MQTSKHPILSIFHINLLLLHLNKESEKKLGVSIVQWCVMKHLIEMPGTSAQELSNAVQVHPSSLTQSLKRLIRKNLIFVSEDPRDSRKKTISITRKGKQTLDTVEEQMRPLKRELESIGSELALIENLLTQVYGGNRTAMSPAAASQN
jgi:DNA-binding MarR family transcriptional regulator